MISTFDWRPEQTGPDAHSVAFRPSGPLFFVVDFERLEVAGAVVTPEIREALARLMLRRLGL